MEKSDTKKKCLVCQEIVGTNNSNCQCEKVNNHCEYCQTNQVDEQSCSCKKNVKQTRIIKEQFFISVKNIKNSKIDKLTENELIQEESGRQIFISVEELSETD